jgi:transcriptional regulator with XRE-family HTH domain
MSLLLASIAPGAVDSALDAMKTKTLDGFGTRLATLRQSRGVTQAELGRAAGVSQRVIAYYETESTQPPGALLVDLARALKVSSDVLLGLAPIADKTSPKTARLLKRLRRIEELPPADQRAVLKLVDAMLETRRRSAPSSRKRKAS